MNIKTIAENYPLKRNIFKLGKESVEIKTFLPINEFVEAVYTVVNNCFVEDVYHPEYRPIAENYAIINYLTDIEIGDVTADEVFKITQSIWFDKIMSVVSDTRIYASIMYAIDELINYKINSRKTGFDKLCESVTSIADSENEEKMIEVKEILDKLSKIDKSEFISEVLKKPYLKDEESGKES